MDKNKKINRILRRLDLKKKMNQNNPDVCEAYEFAIQEVKTLLEEETIDDIEFTIRKESIEKESIEELNPDDFEDVVWRSIEDVRRGNSF